MKRAFVYGLGVMLLLLSTGNAWAQSDDVYYDPKKDAGYNQPTNPDNYDNNSDYNSQDAPPATDKSDGYVTPSDNYDSPSQTSSSQYSDGNGNTYITNNYYDNDEDYYYTNRLNRYYRPNWGMDYYSYQFTPSYYGGYGYNGWNRGISISFGTWYNDPWGPWGNSYGYGYGGGWNDPWRSPYWGWNMGWNSCSYYNSWYDPWYGGSFCSTPYMFGGYGGGWGGYGYGYNQGYYNGYYNGYNDGYYAGGGYGGGQTGNGYFNQGPRRNRNLLETTRTLDGGLVTNNGPRGGLTGRTGMEIPREGIARPIDRSTIKEPSREVPGGREAVRTDPNAPRPNAGNINNEPPTRWEGRPVEQPRANPNVQPTRPTTPNNGNYDRNVQPREQVQPRPNVQPNVQPNRPNVTPRENVQPNRPQPNVQPRENVQPRQEMQSRPQPQVQPRQEMQQRPQQQVQPRQEMQPRPQYQPQQQMQPRPSSPSPSSAPRGNMGGGGGRGPR